MGLLDFLKRGKSDISFEKVNLLDLLRRGKSDIQFEKGKIEGSFKSRVSTEMVNKLRKAKKEGRGDPFREYRRRKILPDKFMYGMNCYLDRIAEREGDEYVQRVFEIIRGDAHAYTICEDTSEVDLEEIPVLFTVKLKSALDAENKVGREMLLSLAIQIEPEPESTVRLDLFIRTIRKKTDLIPVVFKVKLEKLVNLSGKLPSNGELKQMIIYRSNIAEYYNFIIFHRLDGEYAYGLDRKVPLSYCTGQSKEVLIISTSKTIKETYFKEETEFSEKDMRNMEMVYKYKPLSHTIKSLANNQL